MVYYRAAQRSEPSGLVRFGNVAEQAVIVHEKLCAGLRQGAESTPPQRPSVGVGGPGDPACDLCTLGLNGEAPRSTDVKPEQRFSGLRSGFRIE